MFAFVALASFDKLPDSCATCALCCNVILLAIYAKDACAADQHLGVLSCCRWLEEPDPSAKVCAGHPIVHTNTDQVTLAECKTT